MIQSHVASHKFDLGWKVVPGEGTPIAKYNTKTSGMTDSEFRSKDHKE